MNYQCKNCGGNMVFSPKMQKIFCPYCDGTECETEAGDESLSVCASCGGEITIGEFTSASRCPYCGNYLIFNPRIRDRFKPDTIIPFKIDFDQAVKAIESESKKRIFAPASFLSEKSLKEMNGYYVPFFLYDYQTRSEYEGTGTKVRTWRSGNYDYTETSYYDVRRVLNVDFDNIPADASTEMEDKIMDLMEPYDYQALCEFDPRFLSGFFGEVYNSGSETYASRAQEKARESASSLLHETMTGYTTLVPAVDRTSINQKKVDFALFPVWEYKYKWGDKMYPFFVNGQTGKVVGETPISKTKVLLFAVSWAGFILGAIEMILKILEVL